MTGSGRSGSWQIRAEQLGRAIGATVKPQATLSDCQRADVIIAVKRVPQATLKAIKDSGKPWLWDLVDLWPQPEGNAWTLEQAIHYVRRLCLETWNPTAAIWPTQCMGDDIRYPGRVLYHHARPGIRQNPIRKTIRTIGYEGSPDYLSGWINPILKQCEARGWNFLVNASHLADLDIVLAVRGDEYDGHAPRRWKSNVKLANAQGSGTPIICQRESGYIETQAGVEVFIDSPVDLGSAFDSLLDWDRRKKIATQLRACAYSINQAAADLKEIISAL